MKESVTTKKKFSTRKPYLVTAAGLVLVFGLFFLILCMGGGDGGSGGGRGGGHGIGIGTGTGTGSGTGSGSGSGSGQGGSVGSGKGGGGSVKNSGGVSQTAAPPTPASAAVPVKSASPVGQSKVSEQNKEQKAVAGTGSASLAKRRVISVYNPKLAEKESSLGTIARKTEGGSLAGDGNENAGGGGGGGTIGNEGFYGIKIRGNSLFIVDISGSMYAATREGTRLEILKSQLKNAIESAYRNHLKSRYKIIAFASGVSVYPKNKMKAFSDGYDSEIRQVVSKLDAGGSTNLLMAVQETGKLLSGKRKSVDTIYLLTDGEPDGSWDDILQEISTTISKEVVIHCISIGRECPEMKKLAKEYKGRYRAIL